MFGSKFLSRREAWYFERDVIGLPTISECFFFFFFFHLIDYKAPSSSEFRSWFPHPLHCLSNINLFTSPLLKGSHPSPQTCTHHTSSKGRGLLMSPLILNPVLSTLDWSWGFKRREIKGLQGKAEGIRVQACLCIWTFETQWWGLVSWSNLSKRWQSMKCVLSTGILQWCFPPLSVPTLLLGPPIMPLIWKFPVLSPRTLTSLWKTELMTGLMSRTSGLCIPFCHPGADWLKRQQQGDGLGLKWEDHQSEEYVGPRVTLEIRSYSVM